MSIWSDWLHRTTDGASQVDIARRMGVARSTVARWTNRKVADPESVLLLAREYKADPVEGLVAGGWLTLEDLTVHGLKNILSVTPSLFLAEELCDRAETEIRDRKLGRPAEKRKHLFEDLL